MSRIRYRKFKEESPHLRESVARFSHPTNGARYKIELDLLEHRWQVLDVASGLIAASGLRVHQHKMKIDARTALEALGVVLEIDERAKRKPKVTT